MANLTQTSSVAKRIFSVFLMLLAAVILFLIFLKILDFVKTTFWPPSYPPSVAFGKLPVLDISDGIRPPANINYSINTVSGNLPNMPNYALVFAVEQNQSSFGDLARTQQKAQNVGFNNPPIYNNPPVAQFIDSKNPNKMLLYNTATNTFILQSDYITNIGVLSAKPTTVEDSISNAFSFIAQLGVNQAEFTQKGANTLTYKIEGLKLIRTPAVAGSNLVQVNFNRTDIDKIPVFYPKVVNPEIWTLVSGKDVVYAKSYAWSLEKNKFATYPLKSVSKALDELKAGNAIYNKLLSDDDPTAPIPQTDFHIFDVTLGYLITEKPQPYLQPVYVFRGDKGQNAYVSALDSSWILDKSN